MKDEVTVKLPRELAEFLSRELELQEQHYDLNPKLRTQVPLFKRALKLARQGTTPCRLAAAR